MNVRSLLTCGSFLLFLFSVGCASPKPLLSLPEQQRQAVRLELENSLGKRTFSSESGRTTRGATAHLGLVGGLLGSSIAAGLDNAGKDVLSKINSTVGNCERELLEETFRSELANASALVSTNEQFSTLKISLLAAGLEEKERDVITPFATISAKLINPAQKKIWSAVARGYALRRRSKAEYEQNPELYREDFRQVASDLADQLINGPVRSMTE